MSIVDPPKREFPNFSAAERARVSELLRSFFPKNKEEARDQQEIMDKLSKHLDEDRLGKRKLFS